MIILRKIPFYLSSLLRLITKLKNPLSLIDYCLKKPVHLRFKNGLILKTKQLLDPLIIKETLFDDEYQLTKLKKPQLIIDVGSGLGDFSIYCSRLFPESQIIAFEPNLEEYQLLKENIVLNGVTNIKAHNIAIGIKKKYDFFVSRYNVRSSIIADRYSIKKITIMGKRLDSFITKKNIDYLKIDTEGAELEVLGSINANHFKKIKKIVLEYHNHLIKNEDKKIITFLKKVGYQIEQKADKYNTEIGYIYASWE